MAGFLFSPSRLILTGKFMSCLTLATMDPAQCRHGQCSRSCGSAKVDELAEVPEWYPHDKR